MKKRIVEIYQSCRTQDEIESAFNKLQTELEEQITARMADTRNALLENFDDEVHQRLKINLDESDSNIVKWFKPSKGQFQIFYHQDSSYEPDFVVETQDGKYLCEVKRAKDMDDKDVEAKAKAAKKWCEYASQNESEKGGKHWKYILIPHNEIHLTSSFQGLLQLSA